MHGIIAMALIAAVSSPLASKIKPFHFSAIRVNADDSLVLVLPPYRFKKFSRPRLTNAQTAEISAVAKAIVSGPHPNALLQSEGLRDLEGVYISRTDSDGRQLRHLATFPSDKVPTHELKCSQAVPVSLGKLRDQTYAYVQISCTTDDQIWRAFKIGMTLHGDRVVGAALNNGDDINLFMDEPPEKD